MRGSIVKRSKTSWAFIIDHGRDASGKRRQKWVKWEIPRNVDGLSERDYGKDVKRQAEAALAKLITQMNDGAFVDPTKTTFIDYLRDWHAKCVAPHRRPRTATTYGNMIKHVAAAPIATVPLQRVRASDLEAFYVSVKLAPGSAALLHVVIHGALKTAVRDRLLVVNPATLVTHRPRASKDAGRTARVNCWNADEARKVLAAAKETGPQVSAFVALALDSGGRQSELLGLQWTDLDLDKGTLMIARQLDTDAPTWGPTKTGKARTVTLGAETITALRVHRKQQRELKMANRTSYQDHDLVFAKEPEDLQTPGAKLGTPCRGLAKRHFRKVIAAAEVRAITTHGTRHTAATLLLGAGVPIQVIAQRLGHASVTQTLETYAHALPDMQRDAATKLGAVLHG